MYVRGSYLAQVFNCHFLFVLLIIVIVYYFNLFIFLWSDITPCIKIDQPLVVYRFSGNVMTSIITLRKIRETLDVFTPKMQFVSMFTAM